MINAASSAAVFCSFEAIVGLSGHGLTSARYARGWLLNRYPQDGPKTLVIFAYL
jgi:hypothetical protein